ncbi:RNA polymerase sigma factor [Streptomyces yaizuensis]|uniref:RNA polymerase sigma factor n=1 Tax=Streptomyces yaizuensis TaxID=2989713 RepID=A0ABQ5P393_9ACTN|nr:RNA polymerase sigma factor [Streptomyces sp. YSPA8]GLF96696.1 RNA polymerase sigma factor [Streptomyces sp. YSPA8]
MDYSTHARIRDGDPSVFRELFAAHAPLVYRHAVRTTGDRSLAEDVVSLTFLEAWRLRHRLRDEGDGPRPWLMGIAVNVLRNTTRAARRHRAALARIPLRDTVPDFADEIVGRLTDTARLAAAQRALGRLRRADREVFTLCVWSGLEYTEAAAALGIPVGTVRSRLSRARTRLRALAQEELERPVPPTPAPPTPVPPSRVGAAGPGGESTEPARRNGQVPGGRTRVARSNEERTR